MFYIGKGYFLLLIYKQCVFKLLIDGQKKDWGDHHG